MYLGYYLVSSPGRDRCLSQCFRRERRCCDLPMQAVLEGNGKWLKEGFAACAGASEIVLTSLDGSKRDRALQGHKATLQSNAVKQCHKVKPKK